MFIFTLGITILLVKFLPVGWLIHVYLSQTSWVADIPQEWLFMLTALISYIVALIIAVLFVKGAHLRERLPKGHPGAPLTVIGIFLLIISLLPMLYLLSFIPELDRLLSNISPMVMWLNFIAHPLILIGVVQTMLRLEPHQIYRDQKLMQPDAPQTAQELDPEWMEKTFGGK